MPPVVLQDLLGLPSLLQKQVGAMDPVLHLPALEVAALHGISDGTRCLCLYSSSLVVIQHFRRTGCDPLVFGR